MKARWSLAVALVLAGTVLVPAASATHLSAYRYYPTEHDDMGRVAEPDLASTSVLGSLVANCIVDFTPNDVGCVPDGALGPAGAQAAHVAPGCTDDTGRRPSGTCGIYTVGAGDGNTGEIIPPKVAGVQGMSGVKAPGRVTPTKDTVVRILDSQTQLQMNPPAGGSKYLDINRKLDDSGLRAALGGLDPSFRSQVLTPGGNALWAWYGTWQDKNGNGVIDHQEGDLPPMGSGVAVDNEFVWIGKCIQFNGQPAPVGQAYCRNETGPNGALLKMPVWVYPGNHHAYCGFGVAQTCGFAPADFPLRQVWNTLLVGYSDVNDPDEDDEAFTGDSLLGPQNSVAMDQEMGDRTGEPQITGRHWVYGNGWATFLYDQSLVVSTVVVTGVTFGTPDTARATTYDLNQLTSRDVDQYKTFSPVAESLLQGTVKPAARANWVFVRDAYISGTDDLGQGVPSTRLTYDECDPNLNFCAGTNSARTLGSFNDQTDDPGWAKEPNHALDRFPGAVRAVCTANDAEAGSAAFRTHQGMCNSYAGHNGQWQAYMDVRQAPAIYQQLAWRNPIGQQCIFCTTSGPSGTVDPGPGYIRGPGEYTRVLVPGSHVFFGYVGAWRDMPQFHEENTLDVLATLQNLAVTQKTLRYTVAPDTWLGDIVNTTGAEREDGFLPVPCSINGVAGALKEWAQCHPYLDGNRGYAQSLDEDFDTGGEFDGGETGGGTGNQGTWEVVVAPVGGCWTVPTFVWRQFDTWLIGDTGAIEDYSGRCLPIVMNMGLAGDGGPGIEGNNLVTKDLLVLPQGNMGLGVTTTVTGILTATDPGKGLNIRQAITDVDHYGPFGG
jgi:hypothetical protein